MKDQSNEMTQERYHEYMLRMLREVDEDSSLSKKPRSKTRKQQNNLHDYEHYRSQNDNKSIIN